MKIFHNWLLSLIFLVLSSSVVAQGKYVIGPWPSGGLGVCLISVLQHLAHCQATNQIPVVYWGSSFYYYHPDGFNGSQGNVWEYYFEPVSHLKYAGESLHNCCGGTGCGQFHSINMHEQSMRDQAHQLWKKYIHPKQNILEKVDRFYKESIEGKHTIGVHLRGTDVLPDVVGLKMQRIVDATLAQVQEGSQLFVTSDDQNLINQFRSLVPDIKIIEYPCYKSEDGKPLHYRIPKSSYAQVGEDVIVEMLLMAKCDYLVLMQSNISAIPLMINNKVPFRFFMHNELKRALDFDVVDLD